VLLGVTGSVASVRVPRLYDSFVQAGHDVKIVATAASLYFFDPTAIAPIEVQGSRNREVLILDDDEWPGRGDGKVFEVGEPVVHIELRRWADMFVIAPLDANTLAKLALGICDNCLTCVWRAWDQSRPAVLAPAMNTFMWEHPATHCHLRQVALDAGADSLPEAGPRDELIVEINQRCPRLRIVAPQSKRLACGDVGVGGLADIEEIIGAVAGLVSHNRNVTP
jgi:phosphopantothenoylcysteine decarboxylase